MGTPDIDLNGLMNGLKLSEEERSGIKFRGKAQQSKGAISWHAVGKVFTEKYIHSDAITQPLGRIWCPDKGLICREMGKNTFLFHFNDTEGKARAMDNGPWFVGHSHDLLVVADYEGSKPIEEVVFQHIPIWIRVTKIPMELIDHDTGVEIGDKVGQCLEVDIMAGGPYLRIKVRLDIHKPLLRGIMVEVDEEGHERWCPIEYEYLPEYCHICGIIGHIDRACPSGKWRSKERPYGLSLRILPGRKKGMEERKNKYGQDPKKDLTNGGSNAPSWHRSPPSVAEISKMLERDKGKKEHYIKVNEMVVVDDPSKKQKEVDEDGKCEENGGKVSEKRDGLAEETRAKEGLEDVDASQLESMQFMSMNKQEKNVGHLASNDKMLPLFMSKRKRTFKRIPRQSDVKMDSTIALPTMKKKRNLDGIGEYDVEKRAKMMVLSEVSFCPQNKIAGLSEQPCRTQ